MIIGIYDNIILFIALFITSYLLTTIVDYKGSRKAAVLSKFSAKVLFPFLKGNEFNPASVCIQLGNYVGSFFFIIGNLTKLYLYVDFLVQCIIVIVVLLATVISFFIILRKKQ